MLAVATLAAVATGTAPAASAIEVQEPGVVRVDQQQNLVVRIAGVSSQDKFTLDFGDGSDWVRVFNTKCSPAKATRSPNSCTVAHAHDYAKPGEYQVVIRSGKKMVNEFTQVVAPAPQFGKEPHDQEHSWSTMTEAAPYFPCSTVTWFFNEAGQSADRAGTKDDVFAALELLSEYTGLTFVNTDDPQDADITYSWEQLGGPAGLGGRGRVILDSTIRWTTDQLAGLDVQEISWREGSTTWRLSTPGRGWLIVHETMHALGIGHSADPRDIMYAGPPQHAEFGPGDIAAMNTLYKSLPCPVI